MAAGSGSGFDRFFFDDFGDIMISLDSDGQLSDGGSDSDDGGQDEADNVIVRPAAGGGGDASTVVVSDLQSTLQPEDGW